jgi:hypothetical protein
MAIADSEILLVSVRYPGISWLNQRCPFPTSLRANDSSLSRKYELRHRQPGFSTREISSK